METLVFASSNRNKILEINAIILRSFPGINFEIRGLDSLDFKSDIPETSDTIAGNALQKARHIYDRYQVNCFAEDTGLEVDELDGEPGVYSARYAGAHRSDDDNIDLVLQKLGDSHRRTARFRTVIALFYAEKEYLFEGICEGKISMARKGTGGFGYDPIFVPDGSALSFGEMPSDEKNKISHRNKALLKMLSFLEEKKLSNK